MSTAVRVISTGGTLDSSPDYDPKKKSVFKGTNLPAMLKQARLTVSVELESLTQKDSADITDADRRLMYERCNVAPEEHIVITHGTDTMSETARFLGEKNTQKKIIVILGSFVPFSQPNSDALLNLGYAIAAVQKLPPGVWVAMNGEIFTWDSIRKNKEKQRFERA